MRVAPFRALRYDPAVAGPPSQTSAPAYDDPDRFDRAAHRSSNPYTVLELLADGMGAAGAGQTPLARWLRTGVLVRDSVPTLYLYEQHELRRGLPVVQRGIIGAVDLGDLDTGQLLRHEDTDPERVRARADRLSRMPLDITPILAVHLGGSGADLDSLLDAARSRPPVAAFTDDTSVDHRVWQISDVNHIQAVSAAYAPVTAVLADGHHRVEAAQRARDHRGRVATAAVGGWRATTGFIVDATHGGPELKAIHRLVGGPPPWGPDGNPHLPGFHAMPWTGGVDGLLAVLGSAPGLSFGLVRADRTWLLRASDAGAVRAGTANSAGSPLAALDIQVLTAAVLPHFGAVTIEAVPDAVASSTALPAGTDASLLLLAPPTVAQVIEIARAGQRLPAKTTWFRPKPRAGLVMREIDVLPSEEGLG